MPGVYISYPFCNQKCSFCNFASGVSQPQTQLDYGEILLGEIAGHPWEWSPETVYFGGGTPSLIPLPLLKNLLNSIPSDKLDEITLECAPGTITSERVRGWVEYGVNRVSLGVQSFNLNELRRVGRRHDAETVRSDLKVLHDAGIRNVNLDLIAGLPYQTRSSWQDSLDWIERLRPSHVSVYLFEVDEDSHLGKEVLLGGSRFSAGFVPSDDLAAEFYETAVTRLGSVGYERYEISNFARPGYQSLHNLKYWNREPYAGFGLDAHSFDGRSRWGNPDSLGEYLTDRQSGRMPERSQVDAGEEHFFVGLRLMTGIQPTAEEWARFSRPIDKWVKLGMLQKVGSNLRLSSDGVLLSNEILQEFVCA